ncbi:alpha/beta-hydrolase [Hypoxylon sp. FL1150]|nr:alpha/beta-hydrolase [Hypoxylon sp. FL1150]
MEGFPSVEEVTKSPAFPTTIWKLQPHRRAYSLLPLPPGGPLDISGKVHGKGLILIGGIGLTKLDWLPQTMCFGHERGDKYSVLTKPFMQYSTSEMARDLVELGDYLGWTSERELHISDSSMDGVVAQEFAVLSPERIASLDMHYTTAKLENTGTITERTGYLGALRLRSLESGFQLTGEAELRGTGGAMRRIRNYARFAAEDIHMRRGKYVHILQAITREFHEKTSQQLRHLVDRVDRERIMVLHGPLDRMIPVDQGRKFTGYLQPSKAIITDGLGLIPIYQSTNLFNEFLEEMLARREA